MRLERFDVAEVFPNDTPDLFGSLFRILVEEDLDNVALLSFEPQTFLAKLLQRIIQSEMISKSRNNNSAILLLAAEPYGSLSETLC